MLAESRRDAQNREADSESSTPAPRAPLPPAPAPSPHAKARRMIPLRDDNPAQRVPVVTRLLIVLNVLVFVVELSQGDGMPEFLRDWGLVPGRLFASFTGDTS